MDGFSIGKIILGLQNPEWLLKKIKESQNTQKTESFAPQVNSSLSNNKPQSQNPILNMQSNKVGDTLLQMNSLGKTDCSAYIKNILCLPQKLGDILLIAQNPNKPILNLPLLNNALGQPQIPQNPLGEIFNEMNQNSSTSMKNSSILNNLNAELTNDLQIIQNLNTNTKPIADATYLIFSGMISMPVISKLILEHSKEAIAGLIISMASASKNGMNPKQIQDTLSVINSCVAMAESNNPAQTLKSLMLLYLPWLPLNESVGFDLEITPEAGENIKGEFPLTTSNSIDILIICNKNFPKKILQRSLMDESTAHSMNTNIDIEEIEQKDEEINETNETKVNLSATNEMNPYLLLIAHSFIRNTILIDNNH